MENPSKTALIEPDEPVRVADEERDEILTKRALDGIRGADKLNGFGRFATKLQSIFQGAQASQASKSPGQLRAAPMMMSAGVLLLIATALLFLFSKPESTVPGHLHQPTGLSGMDGQKRPSARADDQSSVTENQLVGSDTSSATDRKRNGLQNADGSRDATAMRRLASDAGAVNSPGSAPVQTAINELQTPATVFTAAYSAVPNTRQLSAAAQARQLQLQLPAGTEIVAHTTNAISSGLESPVIAVVDRNVELNESVVIPQGARVIGYTAGAVKDRINIRFNSVLLPNNREIPISGLALMKDGSAGLVGKVQGSGHPILSGAARIGTGAAVVATEFVGQGSLNQPFSQADYLRNQMAAEVATQGNRLSNRFQQTMSIPIVKVGTNQSLRIFLLNALDLGNGRNQSSQPGPVTAFASAMTDQGGPAEQSLAAAQTAYIQALEAQLADMRAAVNGRQANGQR